MIANGGRRMTTPEQQLLEARRRSQILDDQAMDRLELNTTEREDAWVNDFIGRLAGMRGQQKSVKAAAGFRPVRMVSKRGAIPNQSVCRSGKPAGARPAFRRHTDSENVC
jgi:hypothetical protein